MSGVTCCHAGDCCACFVVTCFTRVVACKPAGVTSARVAAGGPAGGSEAGRADRPGLPHARPDERGEVTYGVSAGAS